MATSTPLFPVTARAFSLQETTGQRLGQAGERPRMYTQRTLGRGETPSPPETSGRLT